MIGDLIGIVLYFVIGMVLSVKMGFEIEYDAEAFIFVAISWPIILILFLAWFIEDFLGGR